MSAAQPAPLDDLTEPVVDTGVVPPPGLGPLDPFIDARGDAMYGDLVVGEHAVVFGEGAPLASDGSDGLTIAGRAVCVAGLLDPLCGQPGDIEAVHAGQGLLGGGVEGEVTLDVDPSVVQNRVAGACGIGFSIRQILEDGAVVCQPDTDTQLTEAEVDAFVANNGFADAVDLEAEEAARAAGDDALDAAIQALAPIASTGQWADLEGVPADIADGDDNTQLTETDVDAFVANNGYAAQTSLDTEVADRQGADNGLQAQIDGLAPIASSGHWDDLNGIPADLADGDDNTQLSEADVDAFTNNNGYALDADLATIAKTGSWTDLNGIPADIADGDQVGITAETDPSVNSLGRANLSCAEADIAKFLGGAWSCSTDNVGSITTLPWESITSRPAGLDDGDDNTQLTEAEVDAFVGNNGYAAQAGVDALDTRLHAISNDLYDQFDALAPIASSGHWNDLNGIPADLADGDQVGITTESDPTVNSLAKASLGCADGQVPKMVGGVWTCAADVTGGTIDAWLVGGNAGTSPGSDFIGTTDGKPFDIHVAGERAVRVHPSYAWPNTASPNIMIGHHDNFIHNQSRGSTIAGGGETDNRNQITGHFSAISGGKNNTIGHLYWQEFGSIGGGLSNSIDSKFGTIGGGRENQVLADDAVIAGGSSNHINGPRSFVGGGIWNSIGSADSSIGGGSSNEILGSHSTIAGGKSNSVLGGESIVGGGAENLADGWWATVGGGYNNVANGTGATVGGGQSNKALALATTVSGGTGNVANKTESTVGGGVLNTADGWRAAVVGGSHNMATASDSFVGGGRANTAGASYAAIVGGHNNEATGEYGAIGGGQGNYVTGQLASIAGGSSNRASGDSAHVGGGRENDAAGYTAIIGGGHDNVASGSASAVAGGQSNIASGLDSFVAGGKQNQATQPYTFAAGRLATAGHSGAAVFGDGSGTSLASGKANVFAVQATGGMGIGTGNPADDLHVRRAGDAGVLIEADTGNNDEYSNPTLTLLQDGGLTRATVGLVWGNDLVMTNEATWGDVVFNTNSEERLRIKYDGQLEIPATTRYWSMPPQGWNSNQHTSTGGQSYDYYVGSPGSEGGEFYAPVHLPHGARITQLTAWLYDADDTASVSVNLKQRSHGASSSTFIGGVSTLANYDGGSDSLTDFMDDVVDNQNYSYYLEGTTGANQLFHDIRDVQIQYEMTSLVP